MALPQATISFDPSDYTSVDFDPRRTKVYATNTAENGVIHDTLANRQYIGSGNGVINTDGSGSITVPAPGEGSNPTEWQTWIHFDVPDRNAHGGRKKETFGPFTITASATLSSLVEQQEVPATYLTQVTQQLDGYATAAANSAALAVAAADSATAIAIGDADAALTAVATDTSSDFYAAQSATIATEAAEVSETFSRMQGRAKPLPAKRVYGPYLAKWDSALALVRAGVRDAKILCVGDSTTAGVGGGTEASFVGAASYPDALVDLLNDGLLPAANGLQTPRSTSGGTPTDTRWTLGSGWSKGDGANATTAYIGFGGMGANYWAGFGASGTLTFNDPRINADTYDVYYLVTTGAAATFTAQATGGSVSSAIATGGQAAKGIAKMTVTAGSAATTNTVTITPGGASGSVYIVGIEPSLSGSTKRIRVGNAGASGSYAFRWAGYSDGVSSNTWGGLDSIKAYAPDLTIIDLGINDADPSRNTLDTTYDTYIGQIIAAAQVSGDVLLKTFIPVAGRETYMDQYAAKLRARDLAIVDIYDAWGTADEAGKAGFVNPDGIHGTAEAYRVEAAFIHVALTARADGTRSGAPVTQTINGPAGTDRSLTFATSGVNRWLLRANSTAETGSNAGSDLALVSRTDAGAALVTVFTINRSNGRINLSDGIDLGFGTGTGSKIGATASHKLALWGKTPIVQPSAPPAAATDLATALALVNDLRTKLIAVGILA